MKNYSLLTVKMFDKEVFFIRIINQESKSTGNTIVPSGFSAKSYKKNQNWHIQEGQK